MPTQTKTQQTGAKPRKAAAQASETLEGADAGSLVQRIVELEEEQDEAKARIDHLTQAKLSVEIALARLRAQQEKTEHERANSERLQAELNSLLKRRDEEQTQLQQKLEELRIRAKHDIALLKAERDAALALVEKQQQEQPEEDVRKTKWMEYVVVSILTGIVLFIVLTLFF